MFVDFIMFDPGRPRKHAAYLKAFTGTRPLTNA